MIPKKIHYCWFGNKPLPKDVVKFIETWRKKCPEYEIKEWNETNFDINFNQYVSEAYQHRKWAFVSDVVRIYALYTEGGIYMDTDVEVLRNFDDLLMNDGFLGFEGSKWIATNVIGFEKGNKILKNFLNDYNERTFVLANGSLDLTTNVEKLTKLLTNDYGLILNGCEQRLENDILILPSECFSPYDYIQGKLNKTHRTYSIHWFSQSWVKQNSFKRKISQLYHRLVGVKMK